MHRDGVIHANRGVAGIDGCTSTAVGWQAFHQTIDSTHQTWLVTGDVAFHYDSNAFLTDPIPHGMRIVVINNGGGGIFDGFLARSITRCLSATLKHHPTAVCKTWYKP